MSNLQYKDVQGKKASTFSCEELPALVVHVRQSNIEAHSSLAPNRTNIFLKLAAWRICPAVDKLQLCSF